MAGKAATVGIREQKRRLKSWKVNMVTEKVDFFRYNLGQGQTLEHQWTPRRCCIAEWVLIHRNA